MKIKRVLQGTALTALAAAAWMGAGSTDASAAISIGDIAYNGGQDITINSAGANEIVVGIAKVNVNKKEAKVSAWDVYDGDNAAVNLSKMNVTKDAYIAVKTDADEVPIFIKIDAAAKKNKATFNAGTRIVTFESDGTKLGAVEPAGETYGIVDYDDADVWTEGGLDTSKAFISETAQYQGATIYLYGAGKEYTGDNRTSEEIKDVTVSKDGKAATLYTVGKFPTKQVKLNIPKQANGPKVAVDYVKGTVSIPKGAEYRLVSASIGATGPALTEKYVTSPSAILEGAAKGILEVRKPVDIASTKGKAPSKWTRVDLVQPASAGFDGPVAGITTGDAVTVTVSGSAVKVKYSWDDKKKKVTGFTIENTADFNIDYFVGTPTDDGKGFKAIKGKSKAVTIKNIDGKELYIRTSGDKKAARWAGAWEKLADVAYPK